MPLGTHVTKLKPNDGAERCQRQGLARDPPPSGVRIHLASGRLVNSQCLLLTQSGHAQPRLLPLEPLRNLFSILKGNLMRCGGYIAESDY